MSLRSIFLATLVALYALFAPVVFADDLTMKVTAVRDGKTLSLPAGADVMVGDELMMTFVPPMDGYLYLFSCGPDGSIYQLVPNEGAPMPAAVFGAVKKGQKIDVGMFPVVPPVGTERLLVMFGPEQFDIPILRLQAQDFITRWVHGEDVSHFVWQVGYRRVETAQTRGVGVELHYAPVLQETEDGPPVVIGQVTLHSVMSQ